MRHTRRKERDGLDLARPAPRRRHKTLRQLCALLLGLAGLALLSMAVWGAALPRRLDDALAQHYAAQMSVMQRELFALRRRLAEHEPDAEENAALRNFLQSRQTDGERWLTLNDETGYAAVQSLDLYSRNAPFSNEKWLLVGTVRSSILFRFARTVQQVITAAVLLTLLLGAVSSLLVSRGLARPAEQLYCEVLAANGKQTFPKFSHTGIRELDRFAEAITQLNSSLVTNSTKFLRIMDMASVELGGYELRYDTGSVYVTKNFFALLGAPEVDDSSLTVRTFGELLEHIQLVRPCTVNAEGDKVLTVVQGGRTRYIMLRVTTEDRVQVGLAEDVTAATQERLRIERERDYDVLTGLYNRQAFRLFL